MKNRLCLALLFALLPPAGVRAAELSREIRIDWSHAPDRYWLGPHVWGNRLHDWRVKNGRLECIASQPRLAMRTVHLLTARLADRKGSFSMQVTAGSAHARAKFSHTSALGFLIGVGGKEMHPWAASIVQQWPGPGAGYFAGVTADGHAFIRDYSKPRTLPTPNKRSGLGLDVTEAKSLTLRLTGEPVGNGNYRLRLAVNIGKKRDALVKSGLTVPANRLIGNVALVSHPGRNVGGSTGRYWFRDWEIAGTKFERHADRTFGPIVSTQYTLSRGVLKMSAQMAPLGAKDNQAVELQIQSGGNWKTAATTKIVMPGWVASFRVPKWDASKNVPFRVRYSMNGRDHFRTGTIRRDPVDKPTIVVAGFSCNDNNAASIGTPRTNWKTGMYFPHVDTVQHAAAHKPDVLFFAGDQIYEGRSPTFPDRQHIMLDYMYKWYLWCIAYRELTRDIPVIVEPDDHDVYQGNLWGEGGRKTPGRDNTGGYVHPAAFVKLVERTQTSHLPDPFDPKPVGQGIGVYYTSMTYGRISFAILEDRKFKSGCARPGMPPSGTGRPDHFNDPKFDVKKLDRPGLKLLGERQLKFLRDWAADWRGADMMIAVSQTVFANVATHHGRKLDRLIADLDSNGWPQSGRNRALAELRRGFAMHLCGDQHLATVVHHGIKEYGDAIYSFCTPSIANFYPRAWAPEIHGKYRYPEPKAYLGKRLDGFGNRVTVYAVANPGKSTGHQPAALHDNMPGYGIVRMNKAKRTYTMECWPRWADPAKDKPYFGWPITISQLDNYGRKRAGYLPTLKVKGMSDPVVQVVNEKTGEIVYTLRIKGREFRPFVFEHGKYTVRVGELGTRRVRVLKGIGISREKTLKVDLTNRR